MEFRQVSLVLNECNETWLKKTIDIPNWTNTEILS